MTTKLLSSILFAGLFASSATAQTETAGPRWSAYAGCWQATAPAGQTAVTALPQICVVPSTGEGADLLTLTDKKVTERTHVDADAAHHDVARQGCSGWESAAWSADGRRLFFNSEQRCDAGLVRKGTGIFALGTDGIWTNVVNVSAGGGQGVRVLRYTPVSIDSTYPSEIVKALGDREMAMGTARIAARSEVTVDNVIEANRSTDPAVVEAWVAATEQKFDLDAPTLIRLADAGVAPETIDVMIAVSNPKVFAVAPRAEETSAAQSRRDAMRYEQDCFSRMMDPWGYYGYGAYGFCDDPYRRVGLYGAPYGYGLYGYDPYLGYGYGYGYNYFRNPVVVIVRDAQQPHGRMTKNGYSSGGSPGPAATTDRTAVPRGTSQSGGTSSGASSSGAPSSASSGSSGSGSSSGRTAHQKPPA